MAIKAASSASVPDETPTPNRHWQYDANSASTNKALRPQRHAAVDRANRKVHEHLTRRGVSIDEAPEAGGWGDVDRFSARDPNGYRIEVRRTDHTL